LEGGISAAVDITRVQYSADEGSEFAVKISGAAVGRRLLAIAMVLEGASRSNAARLTGMERQTLREWTHRYNEEGVAVLASHKAPGAAGKLTTARMAELRDLVTAGPDPRVHKVVRFRCADLCEEVERRCSVVVCERTMGKWLHKLGLTRVQPRPHRPKKDAAAREAIKKLRKPREAGVARRDGCGIG